MSAKARAEMLATAQVLLSTEGADGTTFAAVLAASGAPRGSVYHHFPEGRTQLLSEAAQGVGDRVADEIARIRATTARDVVVEFAAPWRALLARSGFAAGCAVAAIVPTVPTASNGVFRTWIGSLTTAFERAGMSPTLAKTTAATTLSGIEGAVLLARASTSLDEFDSVIADLADLAEMRGR